MTARLGNLTGIIALPGMGKTLFMTAIGHDSYQSGRRIAANYKLNFPYTPISFQDMVDNNEKVQGCDRLIDEIGEVADTYDFYNDFVKDISKTIRQGRKPGEGQEEGSRTVYTIQDYWILPPRLRRATMTIFEPLDLDWESFDHTRPENFGRCAMKFVVTEFGRGYEYKRRFVFDGNPYKNLYNTRERIATYKPAIKAKEESLNKGILIANE